MLRIVAGLALVASLVLNFGLIDLLTAIDPSPEFEAVRMLEAGWGIVFGLLLPIPLAAQLRRGGGPVATLQQLIVTTAALALATLLTLKAHEWLLVAFWSAITAVIVALHPARGRLLARPRKSDPILIVVAALARPSRYLRSPDGGEPPRRPTRRRHQRLRALDRPGGSTDRPRRPRGAQRPQDRRLEVPAITAAIGAMTFGLFAIVDKGSAGDLSTGWGAGSLEWGIVVLLATARAHRGALRRSSDR